jgi:hypothetical protein
MRGRLRGVALAVGPMVLVSGGVWSVGAALLGGEPEAVVHEVRESPQERAEFREAMRQWMETGKWPCPASGRPPQPSERPEGGVDTLEYRFGPEDYDCPTPDDGRNGR